MDVNLVLWWSVVVAWALGLPRAVRSARLGQPGWLVVYALLLLFAGAGAVLWFPYVGSASTLLFALLVVLPGTLQRQLSLQMGAQQYARALRIARVLRVLHPADGFLELPALIAALDAARRGDQLAAEQGLLRIAEGGSRALASQARAHLFRIRADWQGYLDSTRSLSDSQLAADLSQLNARLRALGETGQLEQLVENYARHAARLSTPANTLLGLYAQLFVAAFTGQRELLVRLLSGPLAFLGSASHRYWLGTCAYAAGDVAVGAAAMVSLLEHADPAVAHGAQLRLAQPPVAAASLLSARNLVQLDELGREADHEARFGESASTKAPRITRGLVFLNLLAFVGEVLAGGSENPEALYRMGALISGSLSADSAWRLGMALFLHLGLLHLSMNLLALLALGPFVESSLGRLRMLVVYLASGLTGSLLVASIDTEPPGLFLGASGCIMGLLGATAAILLRGFRTERARPALRRLWRIALILALQLGFDLTVPGISLTAHWSGITMGLALGYALVATLPVSTRR